MLYSVLAVGDVVGEAGLAHLERHLRPLQKLKNISFTVVNGENISGVGLTCKQAWRVYDAGADAVTLGNHTFGKMEIGRMLDETPWLLRPANLSGRMPGHGCEIFDLNGLRFRVVNLIGRCTLQWNAENPFTLADRLLKQGTADFTLVDFHAEATSEKLALGYYLDGRVSALWGTHTHVPCSGRRACAVGGIVFGRSAGALPQSGWALQAAGGYFYTGQRHRPLHRRGAGGHSIRRPLYDKT